MNGPSPAGQAPTCPKYQATPGSRRCRHYVANGACALPDELMCVEWLKANGHAPPTLTPAATSAPPARPTPQGSATLDAGALAPFQALGAEVRLESDDLGELWLVPAYTGSARQELSFEHAAVLAALCAAMPSARVTALVRGSIRGA